MIKKVFKRRHTHEIINTENSDRVARFNISDKAPVRSIIGFAGLTAGAGATTLAFAATEYLAANARKKTGAVTFIELDPRQTSPAGRTYDKIGIDRRFAGREFVPFYRLAAEGMPLKGIQNIDGGVNWMLRTPGDTGPVPSGTTLLRLFNNSPGDIVICDIPVHGYLSNSTASGVNERMNGHDTLLALLADLDHLICIFDPLPSSLLASVPAAEACRAAADAGVKTTYVFNKMNSGVNIREAIRFTGIRDYLPIPAVSSEVIYSSEYACRSLASEQTIKIALSTLL